MLEPPAIKDQALTDCLWHSYALQATELTFLPLGADLNTAVYRAVARDQRTYFVKLRSGNFDATVVAVPKFLSDQGMPQIIAPLLTRSGQLWSDCAGFALMVYPFISGQNGYALALTQQQWEDLGRTIRQLHSISLPAPLQQSIAKEAFSAAARQAVAALLAQLPELVLVDQVAAAVVALLQQHQALLHDLLDRTERLAGSLQKQRNSFVLCHGDLHAGNLLISDTGQVYVVDWDTLILAPRERDLMFIGGGQGFTGYSAAEEQALFYRGYGATAVDTRALAYYRYQRIIEDIAAFCEQLLLSAAGGEDRGQSLRYLQSNFLPGGTIELAYETEG